MVRRLSGPGLWSVEPYRVLCGVRASDSRDYIVISKDEFGTVV